MLNKRLYTKLSELMKERRDVALITVTKHSDQKWVGMKAIMLENGSLYGHEAFTDDFVAVLAGQSLPLLEKKKTKAIEFVYEEGTAECYVEVFPSPPHLIVAGAGHVSEPVAEMGKMLGFYVTVIDDRAEFANKNRFPYANEAVCKPYIEFFSNVPITPKTFIVLLTRGHKFDVVSLQELLKREEQMALHERTAYIGMIGSRRRISGVFEQIKDEFTDHNFTNIFSPVGLDIGAQTPAEIAVSIMAEILKVKNGKNGHSLKEKIPSYSKLKFRERVK